LAIKYLDAKRIRGSSTGSPVSVIAAPSGYITLKFVGSGTFTPASGATVHWVVVGGGGGGANDGYSGSRGAGGGGAGAYRESGVNSESTFTSVAEEYTITVGTGGAGGSGTTNASVMGTNGVASSINSSSLSIITSDGGGGGGGHGDGNRQGLPTSNTLNSSGGGSSNEVSAGGGVGGTYGNNGGSGSPAGASPYDAGGGGGGSNSAGVSVSGSSGVGGAGGSGTTPAAAYFTSPTLAGGGGGRGGSGNGIGGTGGGGNASVSGTVGVDGTVSTGSGGGATRLSGGGAGGKGVVLITILNSVSYTTTETGAGFTDEKATLVTTAGAGWTHVGNNELASDELQWQIHTNDTSYYDLGAGNVSNSQWVLRFKWKIIDITISTSTDFGFFGLSSETGGKGTVQDFVGYTYNPYSSYPYDLQLHNQDGAVLQLGTGDNTGSAYSLANDWADGDEFWYEMVRDSTTLTLKVFDNDSYSTGQVGSTITKTIGSEANLRYILQCGDDSRSDNQSGHMEGAVDDIEFYNGMTSVSGTPAYETAFANSSDLPENTLFEETDTRAVYWLANDKWNDPTKAEYMVMAGSMSGAFNQIDRVSIATFGNASAFGTLNIGRAKPTGVANASLGLICGGDNNANGDIESISITSGAQSADYGDLISTRQRAGGCCAVPIDRGLIGGGQSSGNTSIIDYLAIGTGGTAEDFGDLTVARQWVAGVWSDTIGVFCCGTSSNVMDFVNMATLGDATDFGDDTMSRYSASGCTDKTTGVLCGGYQSSQTDTMSYITIATRGDADDFGNLKSTAQECYAGGDLKTRGLIANADQLSDEIQYITIATTGNSSDFGDLDTTVHDGCTMNGT